MPPPTNGYGGNIAGTSLRLPPPLPDQSKSEDAPRGHILAFISLRQLLHQAIMAATSARIPYNSGRAA